MNVNIEDLISAGRVDPGDENVYEVAFLHTDHNTLRCGDRVIVTAHPEDIRVLFLIKTDDHTLHNLRTIDDSFVVLRRFIPLNEI